MATLHGLNQSVFNFHVYMSHLNILLKCQSTLVSLGWVLSFYIWQLCGWCWRWPCFEYFEVWDTSYYLTNSWHLLLTEWEVWSQAITWLACELNVMKNLKSFHPSALIFWHFLTYYFVITHIAVAVPIIISSHNQIQMLEARWHVWKLYNSVSLLLLSKKIYFTRLRADFPAAYWSKLHHVDIPIYR